MIRISLNVKSQGTKKSRFFPQGTDDFKNLRCETLYISDCEYLNITSFAVSDIKLWGEEDSDLVTDHPFVFINIHSMEGSKLI